MRTLITHPKDHEYFVKVQPLLTLLGKLGLKTCDSFEVVYRVEAAIYCQPGYSFIIQDVVGI